MVIPPALTTPNQHAAIMYEFGARRVKHGFPEAVRSHRAAHVQSGLHLSANGHNCIPDQALQSQHAHQNLLLLHFPGKSIVLGGL